MTSTNQSHASDPSCIFCNIISGKIPSFKLVDNETTFAFFDINPISPGHALVIPKREAYMFYDCPGSTTELTESLQRIIDHGAKLHDVPDA